MTVHMGPDISVFVKDKAVLERFNLGVGNVGQTVQDWFDTASETKSTSENSSQAWMDLSSAESHSRLSWAETNSWTVTK